MEFQQQYRPKEQHNIEDQKEQNKNIANNKKKEKKQVYHQVI